MAHPDNLLAEMQGLYGPFTMAERVVQNIWLRSDCDRIREIHTLVLPLPYRGFEATFARNTAGISDT
jgi:hypothetical protein